MNRALAAAAALLGFGLTVLGLAAPPAAAAPAVATLGCRLYFADQGTGTSPSTWTDTFTLSTSPAAPGAGQAVTVALAAVTGPTNGPAPLSAGSVPVRVVVALGGAQEGTVTLQQAAYPPAAADPYTPLGPFTATGTFTPAAPGTVTLTVRQVVLANSTATTYCSAGGDRDHKASPSPTTITADVAVGDAVPTTSSSASPSASSSPSASASASASASPSASPAATTATTTTAATTAAQPFGPASVTMACKTLNTIRDWTATHTLTMSPTNPGFGANVTVTYTFDNGGKSGPAPIAAGDLKPAATVRIGGAQTGTLKLTGAAYGAIDPYGNVPGATLTGQFTATTPGLVTLTVADVLFDHPQVDTECNKGSDPVEHPADTTIVAKFTVKSSQATADEQKGETLPKTGGGEGLPVLLLWGTALLLPGIGALLVIPARRRAARSTCDARR